MYEVISQYRFAYTLGMHLNPFTKIGGHNEYNYLHRKKNWTYICFFTILILHMLYVEIFPMNFPSVIFTYSSAVKFTLN
jgi:hypothetical protein